VQHALSPQPASTEAAGARAADSPPAAAPPGAEQHAAPASAPHASRADAQPKASTSGRGFGKREEALASGGSVRAAAQQDQRDVADKLIGVFREREPDGWRRLIASSRLWPTLQDGRAHAGSR